MNIHRRAPTTFLEFVRVANALDAQPQTIAAFLSRSHFATVVEDLAGAQDGVRLCVFAAAMAVGRVVGEVVEGVHVGGKGLGREGWWWGG